MKKIMMSKYGFVRWPEEDFTDDGSRFLAYRVGERVRVTKCTYNGEAYIDGSIHGTKLPYEVYSKLPHYSAIGKLNGVLIESLTDRDMIDLYEACLAYEQEYVEAENNIHMPTLEEIKKQCLEVQLKRTAELVDIKHKLANKAVDLALTLSEWRWKDIRGYLKSIESQFNSFNPDVYAPKILDTNRSIGFCKPDCTELKDSWYYTQLIELINSVQV
jgi:hypothetical protein